MPAHQPFQLTERSFRRYETAITHITTNYPLPTSFNPSPLSPNTYAARLRDAIRSLELYNWTSTVDRLKLATIRSLLVVRINQHGNIVCGPKELKDINTVTEPLKSSLPSTKAILQNINDAELMALVLLLHNRRIDGVKITGQLGAHVNLACQGYDVEFIEEDDGTIILL